jgi:hypothetical protein
MKKKLPLLIIFAILTARAQAEGAWLAGIGLHNGVWLHSQNATSQWTLEDKNGYLLTLNQQEAKSQQSPVLYLRNTIFSGDAQIDGIARFSINKNSFALSGLYLGFGPRVVKEWGSFYLNLGGVLASGTFNATVDQAPDGEPAEGSPKLGDTVAISFLDLTPAMEAGIDFEFGKVGLNLAYSFIGQKKIDAYNYTYQKKPINLVKLDGHLAPVIIGGTYLTCSVLYKF